MDDSTEDEKMENDRLKRQMFASTASPLEVRSSASSRKKRNEVMVRATIGEYYGLYGVDALPLEPFAVRIRDLPAYIRLERPL